ncbi:MAG: aldo/keto reductase [Chloroflexi bacterium]|nr:aldo/keto reductase [Chloroflexota bacterium]OJV88428.1 MAG: hypothetical protein BGO39_18275 [Chloroflexi bacterium 54-19]
MLFQNIPGTDLNPSVVCLGSDWFGSSRDEATAFALLDAFFEGGGNFVDTALVYGEWVPDGKGLSEKTLGKWLKTRSNRSQIIIGTKGAHPRLDTMTVQRLSKEDIVSDLDNSLHNLGTDTIDLYYLHRDDPNRSVGEIITTLNEQVRAGKIRYFGCSNWRLDRLIAAQQFAAAHKLQPFSANQIMWSLAVPNREAFFDPNMVAMDAPLKAYHQESGLAAVAYTSQARGFFSRLERSGVEGLPGSLRELFINDTNLAIFPRLKEVAQETGLSVGEIALAYIFSQPFAAFAIAGCSTQAQLAEILRAGEVRLDASLFARLDGSA